MLLFLLACQPAPTPPATWYPTVQTLVNEQCADCHRSGGDAPFPLDTYETASAYADYMLAAMEDGSMPPWHADPACRSFEGERILSDDDIAAFRAWVEAGTPAGDASLNQPYVPSGAQSWTPTWSAQVPGYLPSDEQLDDWRCFLFPEIAFDEETWIIATDVEPGTSAVHHAIVYALGPAQVEAALAMDAADGGEGYTCFGGPLPTGDEPGTLASQGDGSGGFPNQLGAWIPGMEPAVLSDGTARQVPPGSLIVLQVHYNFQSSSPEEDTTTLSLLRTETTPTMLRKTTALVYFDLDIPANDPEASFTSTTPYYNDTPLQLVSFTGHMHQLGSSLSAAANGDTEACLVDIPDWDFHWQQRYSLPIEDAVVIQDGSRLDLTCTYDNSQANQPMVNGAQQTSVDVTWGESSTDEMCLLYMDRLEDYTPVADADAPVCEGVADCLASCTGSPTDCMLSCDAADSACLTCTLGSVSTCASSCALPLAADSECVRGCVYGSILLGGDMGSCLASECPDAYQSFQTCFDAVLENGACDAALADCGVAL